MKDTIYEENRLPEGRMPALRVEPMPADTNQHGDVFGGWVDVVSFYTDIIRVGRTSLTVKVVVYAERLTKLCNNVAKITEAELVYVALGPDKKPIDLEESRAQFAQCCSLETGGEVSCS